MSEEELENEGSPPLPERATKKVEMPEPELDVPVGKVVGDFAPDPQPVPEPEEAEAFPVRIDVSRLVFRAPMKNSQSVRYLQEMLAAAGHPTGSDPRGWLAEGTRGALTAFQGAAGLPVTGEADEATVGALFAASPEYVWDR